MKKYMRFASNSLSGLDLLRQTCLGSYKEFSKIWFIVLLGAVLLAGCGGSNGSGNSHPSVTSTVPADLATGVAIDTNITATFDKAMDPSTLTTTSFTVTSGPELTPVEGNVGLAGDGLTAIFTPTNNLAADTAFTVTLTTEVKSRDGERLSENKVWTFTTGATLSPRVLSTDPPDFSSGVALDKIVSATFNVALDPLTVTTETFTLTAGKKSVAGTATLSEDGLTATFTPTEGLAPNSQYLAKITSGDTGVKDLFGNPMKADKVWVFQTGP